MNCELCVLHHGVEGVAQSLNWVMSVELWVYISFLRLSILSSRTERSVVKDLEYIHLCFPLLMLPRSFLPSVVWMTLNGDDKHKENLKKLRGTQWTQWWKSLRQRYNPQNAMSSIWGIISGLFPLPKADLQNILASEGIREGEAVLDSSGRYSVLSNQQDLLHVPYPRCFVKKFLYLYYII